VGVDGLMLARLRAWLRANATPQFDAYVIDFDW
jgi:hypothetical protein